MIAQVEKLPLQDLDPSQIIPISTLALLIIVAFLYYLYKKDKITKEIIDKILDKIK
jgi:hypothetical protein